MLDSLIDSETIRSIFGEAVSKEFLKTLAIFSAAAYVHGRQVRKEIRTQVGLLVRVLQADLEGQKFLLGKLGSRVDKIEKKLHIKHE